jgi:hypothetical protein
MSLVVITVVKDDVEGLAFTCASLDRQTQAVRHLIVDGASGAAMQPLLLERGARPGTTVVSQQDHGIFDAMNHALDLVQPDDRIWFLNAGDALIHDDDCAYVDAASSRDDFTWGFGPARVIERDGQVREVQAQAPYSPHNHAYGLTPICHQATVVRASTLQQLGGFDFAHYPLAADYRTLLQLARIAAPVQWDRPVVDYRAGGLSDRWLLRAHWQQHLARCEQLDTTPTGTARSLVRVAHMTARITTGRAIERLARTGLVPADWRRRRAMARRR